MFPSRLVARALSVPSSVFALLLCLVSLAFPAALRADAIFYVKTTGSDTNDGLSWAAPKKTVQAGLNAAAAAPDSVKQVWVAGGTYAENVTHKKGVALYGGFAGTETDPAQRDLAKNVSTLDGGNAGKVVNFPSGVTASTILDGFRSVRNSNTFGGLFVANGSPVISNCNVTANNVTGIYLGGGGATINNCTVSGNIGIGIYINNGAPTITSDIISGNNSGGAGGGGGIFINNGAPTIANDLISNNVVTGNQGNGGIYATANITSLTLADCQIIGNTINATGGGIYFPGGALTLLRCTINNNSSGSGGGGVWCEIGPLTVTDSTLNGNSTNGYNIGGGGGIWCGNGGITLTNCTINSNNSNNGGGVRCGMGTAVITGCTMNNNGTSNTSAITTNSANLSLTGCTFRDDAVGIFCGTDGLQNIVNNSFVHNGSAIVCQSGSGTVNITGNSMTNCGYNGNWNNLFVAYNSGPVTVQNNTITQCSGGIHCAGNSAPIAILNNAVANSNGIYCSDTGAVAISGNIVTGNSADSGGGIYSTGSGLPTITGNIVTGNKQTNPNSGGGGIYCSFNSTSGAAIIKNNLIANNASAGNGGGIYAIGYAIIANNTLYNNGASGITLGGGLALSGAKDGAMQVASNIIDANSSGIANVNTFAVTLSHNCVANNAYFDYRGLNPGATDISDDPSFVDETGQYFRLTAASPCRDTGDDAFVVAGDKDVLGQDRIFGSHVDMGAYEYSPGAATLSGVVTLEGLVAGAAAQTVQMEFRPANGSPFARAVPLAADGSFRVANIPDAVYVVRIKGSIWLAKNVSVDLTNGDVSGLTATLLSGDGNNDNRVDVGDFGILVNAFGSSVLDPTSGYDPNADFNADGLVDVGDFGLLVNNFGDNGDM